MWHEGAEDGDGSDPVNEHLRTPGGLQSRRFAKQEFAFESALSCPVSGVQSKTYG